MTPRLQLRACVRRSPAGIPRNEERRTGAAPRCSGVLGRAQRSKLDPLTPPVPFERWARPVAPILPCLRQEAHLPRREAPSLDRCSLHRLRDAERPPPSPGLCRGRVGFLRLAAPRFRVDELGLPRSPRLVTSAPGRSGAPVDFCNHHGSPARPRIDRPPRATPGVASLTFLRAAVRWMTRTHDRPSGFSEPGATEDVNVPASASLAIARWELCPDPIGSDTSCHGSAPCVGRRAAHRVSGTSPHESAVERREAPPAQGLPPQHLREEERKPRTRGAFHRRAAVKPTQ